MKSYLSIILFLLLMSPISSNAQTLTWADKFHQTQEPIYGSGIADMKVDLEGNLIVTGTYTGNAYLNNKALPFFNIPLNPQYSRVSYIAKFDTSGKLIWMDTTSINYIIYHIEISAKGDYFFSGDGSFGLPFQWPDTLSNVISSFIGKCDRNGKIHWVRRYNYYTNTKGGGIPWFNFYFQIDSSENVYFLGGFAFYPDTMVMGGVKYSYPRSAINNLDYNFLASFDSSGHLNWFDTLAIYGGGNYNVAIDNTGTVYCLNEYRNYHSYYKQSYSPPVINKYDHKGKLLQRLAFDKTDTNVALFDIVADRSGNLYVSGASRYNFTLNGKTYTHSDSTNSFIFKLDTGLNVLWSLFSTTGIGFLSFNKITNYLYISGNYQNSISIGGQTIKNAPGDTAPISINAFFAKIDLTGNIVWLKNTTYSRMDGPSPIAEDACNNFFVSFSNIGQVHFLGLNFISKKKNWISSIIAKFTSNNLGFSLQRNDCHGLFLKNISDTVYTQFQWYEKDTADNTIGKLIGLKKDLNYRFQHKGRYIITLLAIKAGGCTNTVQDTFNIPNPPFAGFAAADTQGCQYVQFLFSDTSHADTINASIGQSWYWDFGDHSAPLTYTITKRPVVSHVYTQSGVYTVTLVYGNGLCTDSFISRKKVVIIPAPKPGFTISDKVGNPEKIGIDNQGLDTLTGCVPLGVNVTDGSVGSVVSWVYVIKKIHPLPPPAGDSIKSPSFGYSFLSPGQYMIHQCLTGTTGCVTEDSVLINATPVFNAGDRADMFYVTVDTDLSVQGGNAIEAYWFTFPGAFNYALYRYTDNDSANTVLLTQTSQTSFLDINADPAHHSYTYYIEAQDGCGHFTSRGRIGKTIKLSGFENGNLLPQLAWTAYKDWPGWPNNYEILREDPGASYKNIGSTNDTSYQDTALTARDVYGECYRVRTLWNDTSPVSYSNVFCFDNTPQIYIPNIFTPDANNLNDVFAPVLTGIKSFSMTIINRWGEKVFTSQSSPLSPSFASPQPSPKGEGEGWDGSFKGATSPNGIYIYFIKAEDFNGNTIIRKGLVILQQ